LLRNCAAADLGRRALHRRATSERRPSLRSLRARDRSQPLAHLLFLVGARTFAAGRIAAGQVGSALRLSPPRPAPTDPRMDAPMDEGTQRAVAFARPARAFRNRLQPFAPRCLEWHPPHPSHFLQSANPPATPTP